MTTATITSKGQITLPKDVREHLHVGEGDRIVFELGEGQVTVRPLSGSVKALFGMLRRPETPTHSVEEIDEMIARVVVADDERIRRGER